MTISLVITFIIGFLTLFLVQGDPENFFIAGKSLPLWIVAFTLGAQSIDSNAILGNVTNSYRFHFFDGVVLPIGLGSSLIMNGLFLAPHLNREENVLTLPDVLAKRYGKIPEVMISICTIISFMMLLAGNLVGMGTVLGYVYDMSTASGIWMACGIVWAYTITGGLFSVAYTDVAQGIMGWSGCAILAYYMIAAEDVKFPPPSIGFPGYIYPDAAGAGGICDEYKGIPCTNNPDLCCYNQELWCPSEDDCRRDNGAFPLGDQTLFSDQMGNASALAPLYVFSNFGHLKFACYDLTCSSFHCASPNAVYWNWATIFILAFGNLAALDFQARCMASKDPWTARWGCIIGGCVTFLIGIPYAALGSITRYVGAISCRCTKGPHTKHSHLVCIHEVSTTALTLFMLSLLRIPAIASLDFLPVGCGIQIPKPLSGL